MNWDIVGTFPREAGSEFQRDGTLKLKERCPNDLSVALHDLITCHLSGILVDLIIVISAHALSDLLTVWFITITLTV